MFACVIFSKLNMIPLSLHIIFNPVNEFGDVRIHARIAGFATLVAERDNADLRPLSLNFQHQRSTRITLTCVNTALTITGA